jgi:arsenate reductase
LIHTKRTNLISIAVPAWIGAAYFFTSSTSFANPAATVGRMFSDSFAGIGPASVPSFVIAQLLGAAVGIALAKFLASSKK